MDKNTNIQELKSQIKDFCTARDWDQFHNPKDLAIGISTEANELLDLFRFKSENEISDLLKQPEFRNKVEHELADVFFFVLRFAERNNVDLRRAFDAKMQINASKYSIEKAKGSNKKYNES